MNEDKNLAYQLKSITEHFGIKNQMKKFNEECEELIDAINTYETKLIDSESDTELLNSAKEHIAEEIADCMVLLNQFIIIYKINTSKVYGIFKDKIKRTLKRIEERYYETNK